MTSAKHSRPTRRLPKRPRTRASDSNCIEGAAKHHYKSTCTVSFLEDKVGVIRISGIVTPNTSIQVLRDNADWLAKHNPIGQIAFYNSAVMAIDAQTLMDNASQAARENPALECPTALVVHADQLELFGKYCIFMGRRGISRGAFVDPQEARAWVIRQARIRAHYLQECYLEALRSAAPRPPGTETFGAAP